VRAVVFTVFEVVNSGMNIFLARGSEHIGFAAQMKLSAMP